MANTDINRIYNKDGSVTIEEVPAAVLPPNWLGLEQGLRYSDEFNKAFALASSKGFAFFMTTLVNGKQGQATENALAAAFQLLVTGFDAQGQPVVLFTWTDTEKDNINAALEANNFTYRLT